MKKKSIKNIALLGLSVLFLGLSSCDDAKNDPINNGIYVTEAKNNNMKKLMLDDHGAKSAFSVRVAQEIGADKTVQLGYRPDALEAYNKKNSTNYTALPEDMFTLSEKSPVIPGDRVISKSIEVIVKPLTQDMIDSGKKFALPVGIISTDAGVPQLAQSDHMIFVLDLVTVSSVPIFHRNVPAQITLRKEKYDLPEWTVEFRVNMNKLGTRVGQYNNQAVFDANNPGQIYIRFGDAPIKGNILQIKTNGSQMESNKEFAIDTWYHIAYVYNGSKLTLYVDGKEDVSKAIGGNTVIGQGITLCGAGSYFVAHASMQELRFWTLARSESQIANNMYGVEPDSEGLEGYWKMNEGSGNTFNDVTGHGNNGVIKNNGAISWLPGVRSDQPSQQVPNI